MDLFGGRPGHFHVQGMSRTPKDLENLEILDTLIDSASLCLLSVVQRCELRPLIASDEILGQWYKQSLGDSKRTD